MNLIESKKYKTLLNISRKMIFNKGFIVFNKTGSVRVTTLRRGAAAEKQ
jgi:hypothetical protein